MPGLSANTYIEQYSRRKNAVAYVKNKFPNLNVNSRGFARALQQRLNKR